MQTMFHYSIQKHVSNAQGKENIPYHVNFTVFHINHHIIFCAHSKTYDPPYALRYNLTIF